MFLLTFYHRSYSYLVNFLIQRKNLKKDKVKEHQRRVALQEIKHLKSFTYWPIAEIKKTTQINAQLSTQVHAQNSLQLTARVTNLRYGQRVNKRLTKFPLFIKQINFDRQSVSSKIV